MLLHPLITDQSSPKPNKNTLQCIPKFLVIELVIQEKKKKSKVRDVPSFYWLSWLSR